MTKLAVVHLSDVHVKGLKDIVLSRVTVTLRRLQSRRLKVERCTCHLLIDRTKVALMFVTTQYGRAAST